MTAGPAAARALAAVAPGWSEGLRTRLLGAGSVMHAPDGARIFGPGDPCERFVVVLAGSVRVEHAGPSGRSFVLYRVGPGESCVMTTANLLSGRAYEAEGRAEGAVAALAVPAAAFAALLETDAEFRRRAFATVAGRVVDLVAAVDALLTHRVDARLAGWLAALGEVEIRTTHEAIAAELGTAREVVSRTLKGFEARGWVAGGRGRLRVRDAAALARFAAEAGRT